MEIVVPIPVTRGIPSVQGGVETHCENLYPRLAGLGCDVTVITRRPYVDPGVASHRGARLVPLDCPRHKFLEAIVLQEAMSYGPSRIMSDIPANRRLGQMARHSRGSGNPSTRTF